LKFNKTANKVIIVNRQNFVTHFNLFFRKDITIKKNASVTVENFEKLKRLANFYFKKRGAFVNTCIYCN